MAIDFSQMKKNRTSYDSLIQKEVVKLSTPQEGSQKDERFWQPEVDKAGNGSAVIRFLPPPKGEDLPWVRIWNHAFKGPTGKWYIENSLTTLGKPDPVSELNSELWNSGTDDNKKIAQNQKRKLIYISNIYVVKDPAHPENEGKVFLYKYGKKIFDKIKDVMQPQFEDEEPINPFDFWKGANFKLKIRNVEGYRNYDKSAFDSSGTLADDEEMEEIWNKQYSLQEFLDPKNFKSYDELKAKLETVLLATGSSVAKAEDVEFETAKPKSSSKPKAPELDLDEDDESLSYFAKLANED